MPVAAAQKAWGWHVISLGPLTVSRALVSTTVVLPVRFVLAHVSLQQQYVRKVVPRTVNYNIALPDGVRLFVMTDKPFSCCGNCGGDFQYLMGVVKQPS